MPKYENLYLISPNLFVAEVEKTLEQIQARQDILDEKIDGIRELAQKILEKDVVNTTKASRLIKKWQYDARFPAYIFDNVYALENTESAFKRWVGPEPALFFSLPLDRSVQNSVEITICDFRSDEIKSNFVIAVNGDELPWLDQDERCFRTIVPEDPRPEAEFPTRITLGCRADVEPAMPTEGDGRTLWFSFSSIAVQMIE